MKVGPRARDREFTPRTEARSRVQAGATRSPAVVRRHTGLIAVDSQETDWILLARRGLRPRRIGPMDHAGQAECRSRLTR